MINDTLTKVRTNVVVSAEKSEELSKIPVIIISARSEEQDALDGYHVTGKDRYVEKPFEVQNLIDIVNEVVALLPVK